MSLPHSHPDMEVNLLLQGKISYLHGGVEQHLHPGQFTLFWAGLPHIIHQLTPQASMLWMIVPLTDFLSMNLPSTFIKALLKGEFCRAAPLPADIMVLDRFKLQQWTHELTSDAPVCDVAKREVAARLHRLALDSPMNRPAPTISQTATHQALRVLEMLSQNSARILSVQDLANQLDRHPKYLMQNFKQTFGIGLWEYLVRTRIGHAQRMLLSSDRKVLDIAMDSGFQTVSAFYRAFKAYTNGMPPATFRRKARKAL